MIAIGLVTCLACFVTEKSPFLVSCLFKNIL